MDARTVMKNWLAEDNPDRRGKAGRLLQGTSPERYGEIVADWLDFIEDTVPIGAFKAQPSHVKTWLDMRGGAVRTRALRQSALTAFYAYAQHFGHTDADPALVQLRGRPHDEPETPKLSEGQIHLLRWGADRLQGPAPARDRLFAYLMLGGLRSRQITEFELTGVIFEQHRMVGKVWQKGGGTRLYAFPDEIRAAVRAYLPERTWRPPSSGEEHGPLLVTYRGNRMDSNTTPRTIVKAVVDGARACPDPDAPELPARITPDMVALSLSPFAPLERL
ncbi:tyrosine-type recombinase/integrase [Streptomyces albidoflavus]|uniref:tyrosine-type recombinase/integrase n=1 Tax=Streptomyces albidoflavus TaxID=1886 RepID=UPI0033F3E296